MRHIFFTGVFVATLLLTTTPLVAVASGEELRNPDEWSDLHPNPLEVELVVQQKFDKIQTADGQICKMARRTYNKQGDDPTYRDRVGPTIRVNPSDTLEVTLVNALSPKPCKTLAKEEKLLSDVGWWPIDINDVKCEKNREGSDECYPKACQPMAIEPDVSNITNLHTHGWHVSPDINPDDTYSDYVIVKIAPKGYPGPEESDNFKYGSVEYKYELTDHPSGTFWYHAHVHGATAAHVEYGLAGALIVNGGLDNIPEIKAAKEKIFVFQQMGCDDGDSINLINGQHQPTISMQPGEVQRWRFIHAGVKQTIMLGIKAKQSPKEEIGFHEIAIDGLAFEEVVSKSQIELQPGYRSDVLIQAPKVKISPSGSALEYELYDMETSAATSLLEVAEPRNLLATIKVSGNLKDMELPKDEDLDGLAPHKSITNEELAKSGLDTQWVTFNKAYATCVKKSGKCVLDENARKFQYMISQDDHEKVKDEDKKYYIFPHIHPGQKLPEPHRILPLGKAQKWKLRSVRGHHPYHIHVNPFQHILETTDEGEPTKWVWRDTLLVSSKEPIEIRTRYEVYSGPFVMHCHNLEHEDLGMMELIVVE